MPTYLRSGELLSRDDSRLLIVDMQEKFMPVIPVATSLIAGCRRLMQGAKILGVPVSATEQYPKGLGTTIPEIAELLDDPCPEKLRFSCSEVLDWASGPGSEGRHKVVVAGIETHVCILQTALDLLAAGFQVYIPADSVASQRKMDWTFALQRLAASGAVINTTEAILFEWAEVAGTEEFKKISRLATGR